MSNPIILFDGVCNLCNGSVNFIIERDPQQRFRFAALQSDFGRELLRRHHLRPDHLESIVLIENERVFTDSTAALRIAKQLRWPWPIFFGGILMPPFMRDAVYRWIARNRYRWFGKQESCRIPTPELRRLFLG